MYIFTGFKCDVIKWRKKITGEDMEGIRGNACGPSKGGTLNHSLFVKSSGVTAV